MTRKLTAKQQARNLYDAIHGGTLPVFMSLAILAIAEQANELLRPTEPREIDITPNTGAMEYELMTLEAIARLAETQGVTYQTLQDSMQGLAGHVLAILKHPHTPAALYDAVAEFVNEGVNVKDSSGESLLDRWRHSPDTILAACKWSQGVDDLQSMADDNAATLAANKRPSA